VASAHPDPATAEVAAFTAAVDVAFDVVVTCASGSGAYSLRFETEDPPPAAHVAALSVETVAASSGTDPSIDAIDYAFQTADVAPRRILLRTIPGARVEATDRKSVV